MVPICELKLDDLRLFSIKMGVFISVVSCLLARWLQLPNVNSSRSNIIMDVLSEIFEIVIRVLALPQIFPEFSISSFFLIYNSLSLCFLLCLNLSCLCFGRFQLLHFLCMYADGLSLLLDFVVFQQPIGEILDRVPWLLTDCDCQPF